MEHSVYFRVIPGFLALYRQCFSLNKMVTIRVLSIFIKNR